MQTGSGIRQMILLGLLVSYRHFWLREKKLQPAEKNQHIDAGSFRPLEEEEIPAGRSRINKLKKIIGGSMKVLVTGGVGYKGTVLTEVVEQGYDVTLLDNFMYGYEPVMHLANNPKLKIIKHDIRNGIPGIGDYDVIFHLAGISGFPACANPHSAQLINVEATRLLVRISPGQMLINASTTSMYGKSGMPDEETAVGPGKQLCTDEVGCRKNSP